MESLRAETQSPYQFLDGNKFPHDTFWLSVHLGGIPHPELLPGQNWSFPMFFLNCLGHVDMSSVANNDCPAQIHQQPAGWLCRFRCIVEHACTPPPHRQELLVHAMDRVNVFLSLPWRRSFLFGLNSKILLNTSTKFSPLSHYQFICTFIQTFPAH